MTGPLYRLARLARRLKNLLAALFLTQAGISLVAQGTFRNLDFEESLLITGGPGRRVEAAEAIPGWSAYLGGVLQTTVLHNDVTIGAGHIAVESGMTPSAIEGRFSVSLFTGLLGNAAISQLSVVPPRARSILFKSSLPGPVSMPVLRLNGESASLFPLEHTSSYTLYGADVSSFAGRQTELRFIAEHELQSYSFRLDSIQFSTQAVPEPQTMALLVLGAAGLLLWRLN